MVGLADLGGANRRRHYLLAAISETGLLAPFSFRAVAAWPQVPESPPALRPLPLRVRPCVRTVSLSAPISVAR
jgi:hypothetical protein